MGAKLPDEEGEGGLFAEINITPLTDIFLVLLIIFMVTSSVMAESGTRSGVAVNLPKGAAKDISAGQGDVTVAVTAEGKLVVDGKALEPDQLRARLEEAFKKDPEAQVVVQADEVTHHGRVVGVMELAKSVGLRRLAIATKRR
jgi:biopolymer transport protein ExbD